MKIGKRSRRHWKTIFSHFLKFDPYFRNLIRSYQAFNASSTPLAETEGNPQQPNPFGLPSVSASACVHTIRDTISMFNWLDGKPWFSHDWERIFESGKTVMKSIITTWGRVSRFWFTGIACGVDTD